MIHLVNMKNQIISILASLMLILIPQVAFSQEGDMKDESNKDKKPAESTGEAAGEDAAASAAGGVSLGTVAAIAATTLRQAKEAATKIIQDWLDEPSEENNKQEESEKEEQE